MWKTSTDRLVLYRELWLKKGIRNLCVVFFEGTFKVHLTPNFFSAEMKLCSIHIKKLIILSVSYIFKGFKNWQKVAEMFMNVHYAKFQKKV